MRLFTAGAIAMVAGVSAYSMDALPQFFGALLGAFVAGIVRNDKAKIRVIVVDAINTHVRKYHKE